MSLSVGTGALLASGDWMKPRQLSKLRDLLNRNPNRKEACRACKSSKRKCDGESPCGTCAKRGIAEQCSNSALESCTLDSVGWRLPSAQSPASVQSSNHTAANSPTPQPSHLSSFEVKTEGHEAGREQSSEFLSSGRWLEPRQLTKLRDSLRRKLNICSACKVLKRRCDGEKPCGACIKRGVGPSCSNHSSITSSADAMAPTILESNPFGTVLAFAHQSELQWLDFCSLQEWNALVEPPVSRSVPTFPGRILLGPAWSGGRPCLQMWKTVGYNNSIIEDQLRRIPGALAEVCEVLLDAADVAISAAPSVAAQPAVFPSTTAVQQHMELMDVPESRDGSASYLLYLSGGNRVGLNTESGVARMMGFHPEEFTARMGALDMEFPYTEVDSFMQILCSVLRNPAVLSLAEPDAHNISLIRNVQKGSHHVLLCKSHLHIERATLSDGTTTLLFQRVFEPITLEQYDELLFANRNSHANRLTALMAECRRALDIPAHHNDPRVDTWSGLASTAEGRNAIQQMVQVSIEMFRTVLEHAQRLRAVEGPSLPPSLPPSSGVRSTPAPPVPSASAEVPTLLSRLAQPWDGGWDDGRWGDCRFEAIGDDADDSYFSLFD